VLVKLTRIYLRDEITVKFFTYFANHSIIRNRVLLCAQAKEEPKIWLHRSGLFNPAEIRLLTLSFTPNAICFRGHHEKKNKVVMSILSVAKVLLKLNKALKCN